MIGQNFTLALPPTDDDYEHSYWEEPVGSGLIVLSGTLTGTLDADAVHGRFEGDVYYRPAPTAAFLHCNGADGTFDLIRRAGGG
jgi:hypothetical protein